MRRGELVTLVNPDGQLTSIEDETKELDGVDCRCCPLPALRRKRAISS